MNRTLPMVFENRLRVLGLYQLVGGAIGVLVIIRAVFLTPQFSWLLIGFFFFALLFYAFSILCGIFTIKNKPKALKVSLINQYLQLFGFAFLGYAFNYVSGVGFSIGIDLTGSSFFTMNLNLSNWNLAIGTESPDIFLSFNIIALAFIIFISKTSAQKRRLGQVAELAS